MKQIYLDNAATTQVDTKIVNAMLPYLTHYYGNASQPHSWGIKANKAIDQSREVIAKFLGADKDEIIFTSCSTESINLAHKGLIEAINDNNEDKVHIITTPIEHKAVLEACKHTNAKVTYLPIAENGIINVEDVRNAIQQNTVLVSIMYVNNEIGTIQPIAEIGEMIRKFNKKNKRNIYFHVDATQAIQYLNCNVNRLGVDLLSFTGHKIHAPKGVGVLYIRKDTPIIRQQDGGGQEFGLRAGTENVPYIVGLGKAIELINKKSVSDDVKINKLTIRIMEYVINNIPRAIITGDIQRRVPHIASFIFKNIRGEDIVLALSKKGIAAASGSACNANSVDISHVLKAIGLPRDWAMGQLRLSLSKYTTLKDILYVEKELKMIINRLRGKK